MVFKVSIALAFLSFVNCLTGIFRFYGTILFSMTFAKAISSAKTKCFCAFLSHSLSQANFYSISYSISFVKHFFKVFKSFFKSDFSDRRHSDDLFIISQCFLFVKHFLKFFEKHFLTE